MLKRIRREDEDTVDSKTDAAEGESEGIEHIILPQVQYLFPFIDASGFNFSSASNTTFKYKDFFQDHVGLGLCFGEDYSKTGVVVKSLIQHSTASKVRLE